jgi:hypothetical protein
MKLRLYPDENIEDEADDGKIYEEDDLVLCKMPDGSIRSCGFSVNSLLLREGKSPMMTVNSRSLEHESHNATNSSKNVSDIFKHFAVPAGIFYMQPQSTCNKTNYVSEQDVDDELYEKLIALATINNVRRNKGSRKNVNNNRKLHGTKKRKV